ncbi:hypothetical protein GCM10027059_37550 [Myceligenerans halotolerans]
MKLADRIGKSLQWVSAVEQGRRHVERLTDLIQIATVVGCTVDDLIGRPIDQPAPGTQRRPERAVAELREVIMRSATPASLGPAPDGTPPSTLASVRSRVAETWQTWHTSPVAITDLGDVLPRLLTDAHRLHHATPEDRTEAAQVLSGAYQIVRQWLHHAQGVGDLTWVVAERAAHAARESSDPYLIALSAWALSGPYRRAGHQDEATRLCLAAADEVNARIDKSDPDPQLLAAYGMLHLAASISAAQSDQEGRAWALHRTAFEAARLLGPDYCDPWTKFGAGNVEFHGLALHAELGRADNVVELSQRLDIDRVPSVERRSSTLIATARGYVSRGEDEAAALVLSDAERISQDNVHHSTVVRELLRELVTRDRARARPHVRGLAQRSGLLAA